MSSAQLTPQSVLLVHTKMRPIPAPVKNALRDSTVITAWNLSSTTQLMSAPKVRVNMKFQHRGKLAEFFFLALWLYQCGSQLKFLNT